MYGKERGRKLLRGKESEEEDAEREKKADDACEKIGKRKKGVKTEIRRNRMW